MFRGGNMKIVYGFTEYLGKFCGGAAKASLYLAKESLINNNDVYILPFNDFSIVSLSTNKVVKPNYKIILDSFKYLFVVRSLLNDYNLKKLFLNYTICFKTYLHVIILRNLLLSIKPDIVQIDGFRLNLILACKIANVKFVAVSHGLSQSNEEEAAVNLLKKEKKYKIVAVSEKVRMELIRQYSINPRNVTVINIGKSREYFQKCKNCSTKDIRIKYSIPDTTINIITVARLEEIKNLILSLEVLSILPNNYYYIIVGCGSQRESIENKIVSMNLSNKVRLMGFLNEESIIELYKICKIGLLNSLKEGMPAFLVECIINGIPIVSINTLEGIEDIKKVCKNGIYLASSYYKEQIAEQILDASNHYLDNHDYLIEKSDNFNLKYTIKEYMKVYQDIAF